jgi:hypothetical protein
VRRAKAQSFLSGNSDGVGPFGLTFGSIANHGGALTVSGSTLCGNSATYGGGIYNVVFATLKVSNNSTVSSNSALDGGGLNNLGTAASRNS